MRLYNNELDVFTKSKKKKIPNSDENPKQKIMQSNHNSAQTHQTNGYHCPTVTLQI